MKKIFFFAILIVGCLLLNPKTIQAQFVQCFEGDYPPDSYFQCINGQICAGDECVAPSEVEPTYIPSGSIIKSAKDEVWIQGKYERWQEEGCKPGLDDSLPLSCCNPEPYSTCVTSYSVNSTGGCSGMSCGQAGRDLHIAGTDNLQPWGKYQIVRCREEILPRSGIFRNDYRYRIDRRLYSLADKCTNQNSSNQCLANNVGLWAGSCDIGSGNFYKCCCNNQTNNPVSSVPYYGETNDNYPPPEGVCPAGSNMKWNSGAVIDPSECQSICNPVPVENFCYHPDCNSPCEYGTLEALGISPTLASTYLNSGILRDDLTKEECDYLCNDIYVCRDNCPVSVKCKNYTSYNDCVDGEGGLYCFEKRDPVYEICSSSCASGEQTPIEPGRFYYCSPLAHNCVQSQKAFLSKEACKEEVGSECYTEEDCGLNCSSVTTYSWCNPNGSCSSGNYASLSDCETAQGKACYTTPTSCAQACGASSGGGSTCSPMPGDQGTGLNLTLSSNQCMTEGSSTEIEWETETSNLSCGPGETLDRNSIQITCKDICGDWTVASADGSDIVSPNWRSEYGLTCDLSYRCYEDVTDPDYPCECEGSVCRRCGSGETCSRMCPGETHRGYSTYTASRSRKTEVRVVSRPTIPEFFANPVDILYTANEVIGRKYSTLRWVSRFEELGSPTDKFCTLRGNGVNFTSSLPSGDSYRVSPQKTTDYNLICRNSDTLEPEQCYLDSDTKEATVRVFGAGIEETRPQPESFKGLEKLFGEVVKAFTLFREGKWPQY